ncbi:MAG TPA: protein translocase subunit SecF [Candidatus Acidoferrales bacterium]|nr:protein translocase subunit SecF [Candidatus Acidoferrales bacterium]
MLELFGPVNIDWMGKAKYFFSLSAVLLFTGAAFLVKHGGPLYGIDFRGGTLVYVRFVQEPKIDIIRASLAQGGFKEANIQKIEDVSRPDIHEVVISLDERELNEEHLDAGRTAIVDALHKSFPAPDDTKPDINAVSAPALTETLLRRDPLGFGAAAPDRYKAISAVLTKFRDGQRGGLISGVDDLRATLTGSPDVQQGHGGADAVLAVLRDAYTVGGFTIRNVEIVGPKVGAELRQQALLATLYALAGMLVYIAFRFEWIYGAAAVLAVFHDVLITLGLFSIFQLEISLTVIAALLTLVGYSMNDTIVIFDRVRENLRIMRREPLADVVNRAINQTLSRTILTSGLTFLTVLVLFLLGGASLRAFSFAMVVGIVVGTYSSFGIAAPMVVAWYHWRDQKDQKADVGAGSLAGSRGRP